MAGLFGEEGNSADGEDLGRAEVGETEGGWERDSAGLLKDQGVPCAEADVNTQTNKSEKGSAACS